MIQKHWSSYYFCELFSLILIRIGSPVSQQQNSLIVYFSRIDFAELCKEVPWIKTIKRIYTVFQNLSYFRFYGQLPAKACFSHISLHNWPIKAWDSWNWSLGLDKDFLFSKFGVGVIWGQNPNIFKPRDIICKNDALDPVIKKKWFLRSSEVIQPQN